MNIFTRLFYINEVDRTCHKLLIILEPHIGKWIDFHFIRDNIKFKVDEKVLINCLYRLKELNMIDIMPTNKIAGYFGSYEINTALIDRRFIKQGREKYWESIKLPIQALIPIIAIIISGWSIWLNYSTKGNVNKVEQTLKTQNERLLQLEIKTK